MWDTALGCDMYAGCSAKCWQAVWLFEKQSNIPVRHISGSTFVEKNVKIPGEAALFKSETITFRLPWRADLS